MSSARINREAIAEAYQSIRSHIRRTPVIEVHPGDLGLKQAGSIYLKLDNLQYSGSFKARGAFANMLLRDIPDAGVCAASGGNHGAAVAFAAGKLGYAAHIFVPAYASPAKIERIRSFGAHVDIGGTQFQEVLERCAAFAKETGAQNLHAYDDPETLLGQGTIGLELETQVPEIETVLAAVGGGGLIGGLAAWFQERVALIGVEPQTSCALHAAFAAGRPVDVEVSGIAADSLGARCIGTHAFTLAETFVEQVALVSDQDIAAAQSMLWERFRIVTEPGGATAVAALTSGAYSPEPGERICAIVCGSNTGAVNFAA